MIKVAWNATFLPFVSENKLTIINPINDPIGKIDCTVTLAVYKSQNKFKSAVRVNLSSENIFRSILIAHCYIILHA
jgi:hypothetical protein